MLEFMCCYLHVRLTLFILQFLTVFFLVVVVGLVMVVAKSNSHRPARLKSATVRKW